jgi:hypothetical protein
MVPSCRFRARTVAKHFCVAIERIARIIAIQDWRPDWLTMAFNPARTVGTTGGGKVWGRSHSQGNIPKSSFDYALMQRILQHDTARA